MAKTREYMDYLDEKIEIAPANSQEEYQAAETIAELMADHGLDPTIQEFDAYPLGRLMVPILSVVMLVCLVVTGLTEGVVHIISLVLAVPSVALIIFVHFGMDVFESFGPSSRSQNVVGVHRATGDKVIKGARPIVIVAHYDTPRESLLRKGPLARSQAGLRRAAVPCAIVVAVSLFFQLLLFLPGIIRTFMWVVGLIASLPLLLLAVAAFVDHFAPCTLGANDNKASVAALLSIMDKVRPGGDRVTGEGVDSRPVRRRATDAPPEPPAPRYVEVVEEVKGVRHGADMLAALGILPASCEVVYEEPKVRVVEEIPESEATHEADQYDSDYEYEYESPAYGEADGDAYEDELPAYEQDAEAYDDDLVDEDAADGAVPSSRSGLGALPSFDEDEEWDDQRFPATDEEYVYDEDNPESDEYEYEDDESYDDEYDYDEYEDYDEEVDYDEFEDDDDEGDEATWSFASIGSWFSERFASLRERLSSAHDDDESADNEDSDEEDYDEFEDYDGWIEDDEADEAEADDEADESDDSEYAEGDADEFEDDWEAGDDEVEPTDDGAEELDDDDLAELSWDDETDEDDAAYQQDEDSAEPAAAPGPVRPTYGRSEDFEYDDLEEDLEADDLDADLYRTEDYEDEEWYEEVEDEAYDEDADAPKASLGDRIKGFFRKLGGTDEYAGESEGLEDYDDASFEDDEYEDYLEEEDDLYEYEDEGAEELEEDFVELVEEEPAEDDPADAYDAEAFEDEDEYYEAELIEDDEYDEYEDEGEVDEFVVMAEEAPSALPSDPDELHFDREEDEDILPRDTTGLDTISDSYDLYASEVNRVAEHEKPAPMEDPNWGVSSFQPARPTLNIARRAALFDLPDPSAATIDPLGDADGIFEEDDEYEESVYEEYDGDEGYDEEPDTVEVEDDLLPEEEDEPLPEVQEPAQAERSTQTSFWGDRDGHRGATDWKGGAAIRSDLREDTDEPIVIDADDLQDAILELGDEFLIAHDIWFVATGASTVDHAGIKAFLDEHRRDIRGAFLINMESVGAGDLAVFTREGLRAQRRADRRLVRMLRDVAEDLHINMDATTMTWGETESATAMRSRVRAVTVVGLDENDLPALSGTSEDVPDNVSPDQVSSVVRVITELIRRA